MPNNYSKTGELPNPSPRFEKHSALWFIGNLEDGAFASNLTDQISDLNAAMNDFIRDGAKKAKGKVVITIARGAEMSAVRIAAVVLAFAFFLSFAVGSERSAPNNAPVIVNMATREYFAPACISPLDRTHYIQVSLKAAAAVGIAPNSECVNDGGFVQEEHSLGGMLLQSAGLLAPVRPRWNADGSWNW